MHFYIICISRVYQCISISMVLQIRPLPSLPSTVLIVRYCADHLRPIVLVSERTLLVWICSHVCTKERGPCSVFCCPYHFIFSMALWSGREIIRLQNQIKNKRTGFCNYFTRILDRAPRYDSFIHKEYNLTECAQCISNGFRFNCWFY